MECTLKDMVYMAVYVASIAGLFATFRAGLSQLKASVDSIKNILFLEKGGLNIVDNYQCRTHRDTIHQNIRREAALTHEALQQIYYLNQNITKLMVHMKVEPIVVKPQNKE